MKNLKKLLLSVLALAWSLNVQAQQNAEQIIRKLEQAERQAILGGDTSRLMNVLWAPEFLVNNPANIVVTKSEVAALIKSGKLNYEHFDRVIEKISIIDNTAIVMGREEIKPQGVSDYAGERITRRFTNIWMSRNGSWKLVGRQATIAAVEQNKAAKE